MKVSHFYLECFFPHGQNCTHLCGTVTSYVHALWNDQSPGLLDCCASQPRHLTTEVNWPLKSVRVRSARDLKSLPYGESIRNMLLSAAPAMPRSFLLGFFLPTWDFMSLRTTSRHSPFYSPLAQFDILGSTFKWHWMAFGMLFLAYFLSKQTSTLYFRPHCSEENLLLSELKAVIEKRNGKKFKSWFI